MSNVGYTHCQKPPVVLPPSSSCKQLPLLHFARLRGRLAVISAVQAKGHNGSTELAVTMPKKAGTLDEY